MTPPPPPSTPFPYPTPFRSSVDYPNPVNDDGKGNDRISVCEDTNGDGRANGCKVFADGLNIPTAIVAVNGGFIVAQAPHFLFLKDTTGDDKADVKEIINSGWGVFDTHAGPNNLRYGHDNRIWGAVGYSATPEDTTQGERSEERRVGKEWGT